MRNEFVLFESSATNATAIGSDALRYVMTHGHTISVPTSALYIAGKLAIVAIAPRETSATVLREVNRAIDIIAATIRTRERAERAERETAAKPAAMAPGTTNGGDGGHKVKAYRTPVPRQPSPGAAVTPF